ncbi:RDD family protein [Planotetraspora sp. GP83]|uniref:RDD family protein n=1 Tax=Planotetraspora sp. GP83 TaxID=3156264 RepID=UPI0035131792
MTDTPHSVVRLRIATPSLRFFAAVVDSLVLALVAWGTDNAAEIFTRSWDEMIAPVPDFLYFWLLHARYGQTFGKWLFGIKVVSVHTAVPPSVRSSAIRAGFFVGVPLIPLVGGFIGVLNLLHMFGDGRRQCYHDRFADTVVVIVPAQSPAAPRPSDRSELTAA